MTRGQITRGRFIAFEGGEGAGKSTQVARLAQHLVDAGVDVVTTREPGGTRGGEAIRELLLTGERERWDALSETLLLYAARADHVRRVIEPALAAGRWVACDRFSDSTMAYQGYAAGLGRGRVADIHRAVLGDMRPDLTLIFDIDPKAGLDRVRARGEVVTRFERFDADYHAKLRDAFLDIASREPERCVVIDAAPSADEVAASIEAAVAPLLEKV